MIERNEPTELAETDDPPPEQDGFLAKWGGWIAGACVIVVLLVVWAALTFWVYRAPAVPTAGTADSFPTDAATAVAARGQFGDMFGVANALFSGLAFTALIVSLGMQRRELRLQREELRLTRREMALARTEAARQAAALTDQSHTMEQQARNELLASKINITSTLLQICFESLGKHGVQTEMYVMMGDHPSNMIKKYLAELRTLQALADASLNQKG